MFVFRFVLFAKRLNGDIPSTCGFRIVDWRRLSLSFHTNYWLALTVTSYLSLQLLTDKLTSHLSLFNFFSRRSKTLTSLRY